MPSAAEKQALHDRDGYHCRFCGIPVIRTEVRVKIAAVYPTALPWGRQNALQHAAFQVLWAQYDHVVPHAHGGTNELSSMVNAALPAATPVWPTRSRKSAFRIHVCASLCDQVGMGSSDSLGWTLHRCNSMARIEYQTASPRSL